MFTINTKRLTRIFIIITIFILGFLSSTIYADMNLERPASIDSRYTDEVPSPNDWIAESEIGVYNSHVVLNVQDAQWATFTDTHSMEPVISSRANAIEVVPTDPEQIKIGDIVSYKSKYAQGTIIHRVIDKGYDEEGVYFIMKGDNNEDADPGKIRFSQLQRVVVAIVY